MSIRESGKASSSLGLQDFDLLRVIGRGSYAKVLLVRLKKTERIYAMKVVKKELVNDDEVRNACRIGADSSFFGEFASGVRILGLQFHYIQRFV